MTLSEIDLTQADRHPLEPSARGWMPPAWVEGLVSVIIPAYNRAAYVGEAVQSVVAQTYRPIELLLVDDGSTDETLAAARKVLHAVEGDFQFRAVLVRQQNRGASAARNEALIRSHGEFTQYLDSDDVLASRKVEHHVRALQRNQDLDLVWSDWQVVASSMLSSTLEEANERAAEIPETERLARRTDRMIPWEPWPPLYRRRCVAACGPWNERVSRWDDWEYVLRLWQLRPMVGFMPGVYCVQREHDSGRRYDLDFKPEGVEIGLMACREARAACTTDRTSAQIRQLVATRYWETGLEALQRGTYAQAIEGFSGAARMGSASLFRLKASIALLALRLGGAGAAKTALSRYL